MNTRKRQHGATSGKQGEKQTNKQDFLYPQRIDNTAYMKQEQDAIRKDHLQNKKDVLEIKNMLMKLNIYI